MAHVFVNMYRLIVETSNEPLIRQTVSILLELAEQMAVSGFQRIVEIISKLDGNGNQTLFACLDRWIPRFDETIGGHREAAALLGIDVDDIKAHIINDYIQKIGQIGLI
ncbi:hypothetical protein [Effusibacillus pohliae]|uniref:hypothetical protein n=1 Tax=Effusibacillus pohliae TaxID=232270 RepID=UPI00037CF39D|nr:hypothetical protein [Effusibacillus pohliae]